MTALAARLALAFGRWAAIGARAGRVGAYLGCFGFIEVAKTGKVVGGRQARENALEGQLQLIPRNSLRTVGLPDVVGVPIALQLRFQELRGPGVFLEQPTERAELLL
jgi:hypothetical protein